MRGIQFLFLLDILVTSSGFSQVNDVTPPESRVSGLQELVTVSMFDVGYVASDAESGVQYVTLWYRRDGGSWMQYGGTYTSSPVSFDSSRTGGDGEYEVLHDSDGQREQR